MSKQEVVDAKAIESEIEDTIELVKLRGDTHLLSITQVSNFFMIFGAAPSSGVRADTKMMADLRKCIFHGYNRITRNI